LKAETKRNVAVRVAAPTKNSFLSLPFCFLYNTATAFSPILSYGCETQTIEEDV